MNKILKNTTLWLATAALMLHWCQWDLARAISDKIVTPKEITLLENGEQYLITLDNWYSQIIDVKDLLPWLVKWDRVVIDWNWNIVPGKTIGWYKLWDLEQFSTTGYSIPVSEKKDVAGPEKN